VWFTESLSSAFLQMQFGEGKMALVPPMVFETGAELVTTDAHFLHVAALPIRALA
jgi:hypothetical protein